MAKVITFGIPFFCKRTTIRDCSPSGVSTLSAIQDPHSICGNRSIGLLLGGATCSTSCTGELSAVYHALEWIQLRLLDLSVHQRYNIISHSNYCFKTFATKSIKSCTNKSMIKRISRLLQHLRKEVDISISWPQRCACPGGQREWGGRLFRNTYLDFVIFSKAEKVIFMHSWWLGRRFPANLSWKGQNFNFRILYLPDNFISSTKLLEFSH